MKNSMKSDQLSVRHSQEGSVLIVTLSMIAILMLLVGVTLVSTTNKYFTAYQWASWQEALQGAESGADIAMAEMRKDVTGSGGVPWVGWKVGTYSVVNGVNTVNTGTERPIDASGNFNQNGNGNSTNFRLSYFTSAHGGKAGDYITYTTNLSPHSGEGNNNLRIKVIMDAPTSLTDSASRQWLRVRSIGGTDLSGPVRVSEEQLDNRLRKLGLFFDKVMGQSVATPVASRKIELVAKPVTLFAGALTAMVQIKNDKNGLVTDSFNSEDHTNWPYNSTTGAYDLSVSHDPTNALGKNGDVASNAFPIKHDHSENLDVNGDTVWGSIGNNYSQIKNVDSTYYSNAPGDMVNNPYGLDNGTYGNTNPNTKLIQTVGAGGGDVTGAIQTNYYNDLPAVPEPNWTSGQITNSKITSITGAGSYQVQSTDPNNPDMLKLTSIKLDAKDIYQLKPPAIPKGSVNTVVDSYISIWVTGDIQIDDGGTLQIIQTNPDGNGNYAQVHATIYFDKNIKIGRTKETKTNSGGFDVQSDDAKDLLLLGVTQPDVGKITDQYTDTLGNLYAYTPYKASGNVEFNQNDFTGAIYAPDHNIVFNNTLDGKGKRHKRQQLGNEFYGAYVGRTIHTKGPHSIHFDESLNDAGPQRDWGYISWFEDVDVDHR